MMTRFVEKTGILDLGGKWRDITEWIYKKG